MRMSHDGGPLDDLLDELFHVCAEPRTAQATSNKSSRGGIPRSVKDSLRRSVRPLPDLPRSQSLACADRVPLHTERP